VDEGHACLSPYHAKHANFCYCFFYHLFYFSYC